MIFDQSNIKYFKTFEGSLICNICEQPTKIDESISSKGFHLICNECACKICNVLGISFDQVVIALHNAADIMEPVNAHRLKKVETMENKPTIIEADKEDANADSN